MGEAHIWAPLGRRRQRGYTLLATGLALFAVVGITGLAIDLGRLYVAKNETQTYVDSAALAAALELDGTSAGFQRARDAVANSSNQWNFGNNPFSGAQVEFSQNATGPWEASPMSAAGYRFVRVRAGVPVPMTFIRVVAEGATRPVNAEAVAGQVLVNGLSEGACPFSPLAHNGTHPDYGLWNGGIFTLRWAANPKLNKPNTLCAGDATPAMLDKQADLDSEQRGYIEETSAAVIRKAVLYDYQTVYRQIGDSVTMTGGTKATITQAVIDRIYTDSDTQSATFDEYTGNGRRIMACPVNTGPPDYQIVQIAAFFLLPPGQYTQSGQRPICAEYIGPYVQGSPRPGAGSSGYYVVRLVQ